MARDKDEQYPNKSISSSKKDDKWINPKGKEKDPNKPKPKPKDDGEHPKGMGGSKVPSKPGPKKPASPAAKRLQRTASRSK